MTSRANPTLAAAILAAGVLLPGASARPAQEPTAPSANAVCEWDREQRDLSVWPNRRSSGNSDPWIWKNHDRIRKMRPRVLVLNFANDVDMVGVRDRTEGMIDALAEASRYHGYRDESAPAFLEYQVVRYVDLRDDPIPPERARRNSRRCPYVSEDKPSGCDYGAFYGDDFAAAYGFREGDGTGPYLNLHELIRRGIVHELWFYQIHDDWGAPLETIEYKQYYDDHCRPIPGIHGPAGNGHSPTMPWSGRSFRITFFNPHRGIGCGMENFSHAMEGMANFGSIGYYRRFFDEYAEFDLDRRFGLPFRTLYAFLGGEARADYPAPTTMHLAGKGREHTVEPYVARGGSVHFPPGARGHYDLTSPFTVRSTIESWRMRNGPGGEDLAADFNKDRFSRWRDFCPDCMGPWLVYWRQNMPGLDNRCLDDEGRAMKNWWPFLFY